MWIILQEPLFYLHQNKNTFRSRSRYPNILQSKLRWSISQAPQMVVKQLIRCRYFNPLATIQIWMIVKLPVCVVLSMSWCHCTLIPTRFVHCTMQSTWQSAKELLLILSNYNIICVQDFHNQKIVSSILLQSPEIFVIFVINWTA